MLSIASLRCSWLRFSLATLIVASTWAKRSSSLSQTTLFMGSCSMRWVLVTTNFWGKGVSSIHNISVRSGSTINFGANLVFYHPPDLEWRGMRRKTFPNSRFHGTNQFQVSPSEQIAKNNANNCQNWICMSKIIEISSCQKRLVQCPKLERCPQTGKHWQIQK